MYIFSFSSCITCSEILFMLFKDCEAYFQKGYCIVYRQDLQDYRLLTWNYNSHKIICTINSSATSTVSGAVLILASVHPLIRLPLLISQRGLKTASKPFPFCPYLLHVLFEGLIFSQRDSGEQTSTQIHTKSSTIAIIEIIQLLCHSAY